jgi:hypothetical protein
LPPGALRALLLAALVVLGLTIYVVALRALKVISPRDLMRTFGRGL